MTEQDYITQLYRNAEKQSVKLHKIDYAEIMLSSLKTLCEIFKDEPEKLHYATTVCINDWKNKLRSQVFTVKGKSINRVMVLRGL